MTKKIIAVTIYLGVAMSLAALTAFTACGHDIGTPHEHCGGSLNYLLLPTSF